MRRALLLLAAGLIAAPHLAPAQTKAPLDSPALSFQTLPFDGWTPERFQRAQKRPPIVIRQDALGPPSRPTSRPPRTGAAHAPTPGAPPSSGLAAGDPQSVPLKYVGKLFANGPQGGDFYCSAQFIHPRVILTAAHCVRDRTGAGAKDFRFALQHHEGVATKQYTLDCAVHAPNYLTAHERTWTASDYALMRTADESSTGHFGWQADWRGAYEEAVLVGYPQDVSSGQIVQTERGTVSFFGADPELIVGLEHGNRAIAEGSSGGAIVGNFDSNGGPNANRVISVASSTYGGDGVTLGPYLGQAFKDRVELLAKGCPP